MRHSVAPTDPPPLTVRAAAWLAYLGGLALFAVVIAGVLTAHWDSGVGGAVFGGCLLLLVLAFGVLAYLAGRSLLRWGNALSLQVLAGLPLIVGGAGVVNGLRRVTADTVGLLIGFSVVLLYGVSLIVLPKLGRGPAWLAARGRWAAAERERRMAEARRRLGG